MALSSCKTYKNNVSRNFSNAEFIALQNFSKNKDLIIQKSDKGNFVVITDRHDYVKKTDRILTDQKKFSVVYLIDGTLLHFAFNQEKHVDKVLKRLVECNSMTEKNGKSLNLLTTDQLLRTVQVRYINQAWRIARHFDQICML